VFGLFVLGAAAFMAGLMLTDGDERVQDVVGRAAERSRGRGLLAVFTWFALTAAGLAVGAVVIRLAAQADVAAGVVAMVVVMAGFGTVGVSFTLTQGGRVSPTPAEFRRGRRIDVGTSRLVTIVGGLLGLVLVMVAVGAAAVGLAVS
jgi:hypothetical protein